MAVWTSCSSVRDSTGSWGNPIHLDYPLNSQSDDFAVTFNPDGRSGFMSSDRYGYDRLFDFDIVERPLMVEGIVVDSITGAPIPNATINLLDADDGSAVALQSDMNGAFSLKLPHGKLYRAEATHGHLLRTKHRNPDPSRPARE